MRKIKGAVFDMDGLMFDSERLVYDIWLNMMTARGYEYNRDIYKLTVGKRKLETERYYKNVYGADFPYWELAGECRSTYAERVRREGIPVKKGLYDILRFFSDKGLGIALATSTSRESAELNLKLAGVAEYFDAIVCGGDVKNGKPHPEVFLTAAERLGLEPKYCAAFEDSPNGIASAYNAGMITVMVPDLVEPEPELLPKVNLLCGNLLEAKERLAEEYII